MDTATTATAKDLWRDVVRLTDAVGTPQAKAIAVSLYIHLKESHEAGFTDRVKAILRPCKDMAGPAAKMPQFDGRRKPLFAFVYSTSSNMSNLLPVAQEAARAHLKFDVLL